MAEILCSTGALIGKPNNRDYRILQKLAKQLQCDGYEFMMYSSWYEEWEILADYLAGLNLHIPVLHCDKRIGEAISQGEDVAEADSEAMKNFRGIVSWPGELVQMRWYCICGAAWPRISILNIICALTPDCGILPMDMGWI